MTKRTDRRTRFSALKVPADAARRAAPRAASWMLSFLLTLCLVLAGARADAQDAPRGAICALTPYPAYPGVGSDPGFRLWTDDDAPEDWRPPDCPEWRAEDFKLVVALSGVFADDGDVEDMLARFGAVSATRRVMYWSVTDQAWRPLIKDAFALAGPHLEQRRDDFTAAELATGAELFFAEEDSR